MKLSFSALFVFSALLPLSAQTTPTHTAKPAGTSAARPGATACAKLPEISPKVPALPAGTPCAKHLYTISTTPTVKLENISPLEPASLKADMGIESTSFSLDYADIKVGTGQLVGPHSYYSMIYTGYLMSDGAVFDATAKHGGEPLTFPYGQHKVILGWDTGLAGMRVGGKRRLYIPFQLAYGANSPQGSGIPPRSSLIFDVELVKISDTPPAPKPAPAPAPAPSKTPLGATPAPAKPATPPATPPPAAVPPAAAPKP